MVESSCKYCGSKEGLMMSSRYVNGTVETIDVCLRCYWRDRFEAEGNGKSILSEKKGIEGIESVGSINPPGLRERV